jgi:hypothetical protein
MYSINSTTQIENFGSHLIDISVYQRGYKIMNEYMVVVLLLGGEQMFVKMQSTKAWMNP